MKPSGIILSECCDSPIIGEVISEQGKCSECGDINWAYDTGLAKPLTLAEVKMSLDELQ